MTITEWVVVITVLSLNIIAIVVTVKGRFTNGAIIQGLGDTISLIYICTQLIQYH